jgi:hypothetical protein
MKKIVCFVAMAFLVLLLLPAVPANAAAPLDEIKYYEIRVDMRNDGTMDIRYHFDWKVLDDISEGPLTWVKIGIPNKHVDSIKAITNNIKKISYLSDSGSYVRIDLDREYHAGETVSFDFSIHQSYMYRLDNASNMCSYTFVPGWFDGIEVETLKILWNKTDVYYSDSTGIEGGYITWETQLDAGERLVTIVRYSGDVFDTSPSAQAYDEADQEGGSDGDGVIIFIVFVIVAVIIAVVNGNNGYRGGFGGRGGGVYHTHHSCACASSCACACACACAGGGRAGCSAKNFYGAAVQTDALFKKLQENK